ncbi:MAG: co-chaperone YbbN [Gammaproteobacteria bacterium]|nr:co-chaperone YbbN [Gammaproteobacteria bacterium]
MAESPYIVEVNEQNFLEIVIEGSRQVPVLVDFWADWCNPCKMLMPVLSALADEYQGRFILAKLDTEDPQCQAIAAQLGIRSLPTVKLFKDGQPVDEFMGALPESQVRAFLDKHIEKVVDNRVEQAMYLFQQGDVEAAKTLLVEAYNENQQNGQTALALGQVCMAAGDYESAELVLKNLSEEDANSTEGRRLKGMLTLSQADTSDKDLQTLATEVAEDGNSKSRYHFGIKLAMQGRVEEAIIELLTLMQHDREFGDDAARKCLITIFDVLGNDPLVGTYRRKMFNLLH